MAQVILGIDPSLNSSGYAFVTETGEIIELGKIVPGAKLEEPEKLLMIYRYLKELVEQHNPTAIVCEDQFMKNNAKTLKILSHVRGIVMMLAAEFGIPFVLHAPSVIKEQIAGKGNAPKEKIFEAVALRFRDDFWFKEYFPGCIFIDKGKKKNDDISDALAIALTHILLEQYSA